MSLDAFHPTIARWFAEQLGEPTPVHLRAWPAIRSGAHVLIAAPMGSGKTLAAFLAAIDSLFARSLVPRRGPGFRERREQEALSRATAGPPDRRSGSTEDAERWLPIRPWPDLTI
jgi:superfamily II DNA/RNA helicase